MRTRMMGEGTTVDRKPRGELVVPRRRLIMAAGAATLAAACGPADEFDAEEPIDTLELPAPDFSAVPSWSPTNVQNFFAFARDNRLLEMDGHPGFMRRVSWQYPDGGCESRADAICAMAMRQGLPTPYKARCVGWLKFNTNNAPPGRTYVNWGFHIAPIVRSFLNLVYVLDPSVSPNAPPSITGWLSLIGGNINGVEVRDWRAWPPTSGTWLEEQKSKWLRREWDRQVALGRDPYQVLGNDPPW